MRCRGGELFPDEMGPQATRRGWGSARLVQDADSLNEFVVPR